MCQGPKIFNANILVFWGIMTILAIVVILVMHPLVLEFLALERTLFIWESATFWVFVILSCFFLSALYRGRKSFLKRR